MEPIPFGSRDDRGGIECGCPSDFLRRPGAAAVPAGLEGHIGLAVPRETARMLPAGALHQESHPIWDTRRLWSLWDMINFRFSAIHHVMTELSVLIRTSNHNMEFMHQSGISEEVALQSPHNTEALDDCRKAAVACAELADSWLKALNCIHIDASLKRLKGWGEGDGKRGWSELNTVARAARDAIERELRDYYYYQYTKNKSQRLLSWETDWEPTRKAFVDIDLDIFPAVDCYALQHNTASVFHCMRVLEHGMRALAFDLGLTFDLQQWHNIIEEIEGKIREQRKLLPRGEERNERLQFLSEAAKEFFYFKDGWRNHVSHNRGKYDEHQAASVLEHTRTFMNFLATRLAEY